jgi:hypothetical protein
MERAYLAVAIFARSFRSLVWPPSCSLLYVPFKARNLLVGKVA